MNRKRFLTEAKRVGRTLSEREDKIDSVTTAPELLQALCWRDHQI